MARKTYSDEIIDYSDKVLTKLMSTQMVMALVANDPDIDLDSEEAEKWESHFFDYDYVDDTVTEAGAFIMVDVEMAQLTSTSMKTMTVYIDVACSKDYMSLKGSGFTGLKGNRRDNLVRFIDKVLHDDPDFGIGELQLQSITSVRVPRGFTSKQMTYDVPDFNERKIVG